MKKLFKFTIKVILVVLLALGLFLGMVAVTKYYPDKIEVLTVQEGNLSETLHNNRNYSIVTWNTGYAGLDKSQDFFMDGGQRSHAGSRKEVIENMNAINHALDEINADFVLLQEVDISGKRSFNVNQMEAYTRNYYYQSFATNYKNIYVPVPLTNPMGSVHSGIMTLSKAKPTEAKRYQFDGKEMFIVQMFELDRAFTMTRYPVNDKELVVINAHFSAFDKGGKIRKQQLAQIELILNEEYNRGNYIILGGDFNHELPNTDANIFKWSVDRPDWIQKFPSDFNVSGYKWPLDTKTPTVRSLEVPYTKGINFVAIIDGYLVSDNIEVTNVKTYDFNFEHTDHNPVLLSFKLK